jgi:hypothetical protein
VENDEGLHVAPEQQPVAQLVLLHALHAPAVHVCGLAHVSHAPPPEPHEAGVSPGSHVGPEQHPLGHVFGLQAHTPPTQACPAAHAAPPPQVHTPAAAHPSALDPQLVQVPPPLPQERRDLPCSQVVPEQHPDPHDVASHSQVPAAEHACPGAHAGPEPHAHAPAMHLFATFGAQATHAEPLVPQLAGDAVVHVPFAQHPFGHDVASQTHLPPEQCWPSLQGAPPPQAHVPERAQASAVVGLHATHAPPAAPHAPRDGLLHVGPEQHPAQLPAHPLHAPAVQVSAAPHGAQAAPAPPHAAGLSPASQVLPEQHPVGHETPSQTQVPPRHR